MDREESIKDSPMILASLQPTESAMYLGITMSSTFNMGTTLSSATLSSVTTSSNGSITIDSRTPIYQNYSTASQANALLQKMRSLRKPLNMSLPQTPSYQVAELENKLSPLIEENGKTNSDQKIYPSYIEKSTNLDYTKEIVSPATAVIAEIQSIEKEWEVCIKDEISSELLKKIVENNDHPDNWLEFLEHQLRRKCITLFDEACCISKDDIHFLVFIYSKAAEAMSSDDRSKDVAYLDIWLQYIWILRQKNRDMDEIRNMFKHLKSFSVGPKFAQFYIHLADFERLSGNFDKAKTVLSNGLKFLNENTQELQCAIYKLKENESNSLLVPVIYNFDKFLSNQAQCSKNVDMPENDELAHETSIASPEINLSSRESSDGISTGIAASATIDSLMGIDKKDEPQTTNLQMDLSNQQAPENATITLSARPNKKLLMTNFRKMGLVPRRMSTDVDSTREMTLDIPPDCDSENDIQVTNDKSIHPIVTDNLPYDSMQPAINKTFPIVPEELDDGNVNVNHFSANPPQLLEIGQPKPIYNEIQTPLKGSPVASLKPNPIEEHRIVTEIVKVNGVPYSRLELIGKGGSSKVYKIMNMQGKILAMKKVKLDGADESMILSYMNEITLLNRLKGCDSIIKLYDSEIDNVNRYITITMEYGEIDLAKLLHRQQGKAINENFIRLYWQQMLEAVHAIHEERIVHSDLKPANFLVVEGSLKLIDFGIANAIQNDTTNIVRESQVRSYLYISFARSFILSILHICQVGTVNYMSPEALLDTSSREPGNDVRRRPIMKVNPKS